MRAKKVFVYGASGHGRVVGDILQARKDANFIGYIDDAADLLGRKVLGFPVFGNGEWLHQEATKMELAVALGIADNIIRQRLARQCTAWGIELVTLVHPTASVSSSAKLGYGVVVMAQAAINAEAKIGDGAIVNTSAVVEHDVQIGDFAHVSPGVVMAGATRLGKLSHLGIGALVIPCVSVGAKTVVGAGSVVVRNIPDDVIAYGVPARVQRAFEAGR